MTRWTVSWEMCVAKEGWQAGEGLRGSSGIGKDKGYEAQSPKAPTQQVTLPIVTLGSKQS